MNYRKTFTLRLEEKMLEKLHFTANKDKRSLNNQIEVVLEKFLEAFEDEYGKIPIDESED